MLGTIRRDKRDIVFSELIRLRPNYVCERCHRVFPDKMGMECSHVYSRRHKATRWLPDNAFGLCRGCHRTLGENPIEHTYFAREKLGETRFQTLRHRAHTSVKYTKLQMEEIYQHMRGELKRLREMRADGETGYLEIISYD